MSSAHESAGSSSGKMFCGSVVQCDKFSFIILGMRCSAIAYFFCNYMRRRHSNFFGLLLLLMQTQVVRRYISYFSPFIGNFGPQQEHLLA